MLLGHRNINKKHEIQRSGGRRGMDFGNHFPNSKFLGARNVLK
jgi:hypothetical protein